MATYALTGGTGALGRQVLKKLAATGNTCVVLGRSAPEVPPDCYENIEWVKLDLLDAAAPLDVIFRERKVEKVVHAAWVTKHPDYWSCLSNTEWQAASIRLFEALVDAGGNHFTFVGSCAEYNWKEWGVHDEPHSSYPETLYGASKLIVSKTLARRAREQGVKFATCRVFFPFGIHENPSRVTSLVGIACCGENPSTCEALTYIAISTQIVQQQRQFVRLRRFRRVACSIFLLAGLGISEIS